MRNSMIRYYVLENEIEFFGELFEKTFRTYRSLIGTEHQDESYRVFSKVKEALLARQIEKFRMSRGIK